MPDVVYTERASRVPGAVLWWRRAARPAAYRVLPDGCLDLLWRDGELVVAGPDRHAFLTAGGGASTYVGLRLPPGLGPAFLGVPAHPLVGLRVPLGDLWSPTATRRATDAVAAGPATAGSVTAGPATAGSAAAWPGAGSIAAGLEEVVLARLAEHEPDPMVAPLVTALDDGFGIGDIADVLGLSERQLHRRSLAAFGYGAKTLGRIRRLQRALALPRALSGAAAAAAAGYADQAHLTREARDLAGVPFGELRAA